MNKEKYKICEECGASNSCKEVNFDEYRKIKKQKGLYEFDNKETKEKKEKKCEHKWCHSGGSFGCWNFIILYCEKCGEVIRKHF